MAFFFSGQVDALDDGCTTVVPFRVGLVFRQEFFFRGRESARARFCHRALFFNGKSFATPFLALFRAQKKEKTRIRREISRLIVRSMKCRRGIISWGERETFLPQ